MVVFLAAVIAFLTRLTPSYSRLGLIERTAGSVFAFRAVGDTLTHYVVSCIGRHCRGLPTSHEQGTVH